MKKLLSLLIFLFTTDVIWGPFVTYWAIDHQELQTHNALLQILLDNTELKPNNAQQSCKHLQVGHIAFHNTAAVASLRH